MALGALFGPVFAECAVQSQPVSQSWIKRHPVLTAGFIGAGLVMALPVLGFATVAHTKYYGQGLKPALYRIRTAEGKNVYLMVKSSVTTVWSFKSMHPQAKDIVSQASSLIFDWNDGLGRDEGFAAWLLPTYGTELTTYARSHNIPTTTVIDNDTIVRISQTKQLHAQMMIQQTLSSGDSTIYHLIGEMNQDLVNMNMKGADEAAYESVARVFGQGFHEIESSETLAPCIAELDNQPENALLVANYSVVHGERGLLNHYAQEDAHIERFDYDLEIWKRWESPARRGFSFGL